MIDYQISNYLLNTYPRLLTYGALELYKRGYVPTEKQITKKKIVPRKVSAKETVMKIITIFSLYAYDKLNDNESNNKKFNYLIQLIPELPDIFDNIVGNELKKSAQPNNDITDIVRRISIFIAGVTFQKCEKLPDSEYGNKFEYLRVKLAEP